MSIEFYYMPESPPCRAVEMLAGMIGIKLNKHYLNLNTQDHHKEDYVRLNPTRRVPFIVDGDFMLGESRAIMAYLVNQYKPDDEHLYPKDPKVRAKIDELLHYECGTFVPIASKLLKPIIYGQAKELNKNDEIEFRGVLHYLDKRLGENHAKRFMMDNHPNIADISLAASLTLILSCDYSLSEYKHLAAYLERVRAGVPNFSEINDEPSENIRKYIVARQKGLSVS